jgi:hypothetical protein
VYGLTKFDILSRRLLNVDSRGALRFYVVCLLGSEIGLIFTRSEVYL